ncbi:MAG: VWA domain-containing protein, partial [Alphaproteobacteria bacterium]|nr:VWA domain-containing protein [Alphaproteobacteria bacterium]
MGRVQFTEYLSCLPEGHPHLEALDSAYQEAARVLSPRGLANYLEGVRAMCSLGRGEDLILTYIQETPRVAKEVGEDIVPDVVHAVMRLSSLTSGSVLTVLLATLPLAARRLGDARMLNDFLALVHQLAGKAPRGLRPMLENLDELLGKLTLGGFRRWTLWGAQAHQRDQEGQIAYFGLKTESSRAVLQKERRGTLFIDNQRKLNF